MITFSPSRLLLAVALASSFTITACDVRTDADKLPESAAQAPITTPANTAFTEGTHPIFNVAAAQLPLVTDLPFLAAAGALGDNFDGTALVSYNTAITDDDKNPVKLALNDLDGWSTNAYFDISFSGSLDPTSVHETGAGQNVFLVKLNTGTGDPLDPASIVPGSAAVAAVLNAETASDFSVSVQSLDLGAGTVSNNTIRITPKKPLDPASKYLVFMTNTIENSGDVATTESTSYHALSGSGGAGLNAQLQGVATWLDGMETIAANIIFQGAGGALTLDQARSLVIVSYSFTTTDPHKPLVAMAAPRAALVTAGASSSDAAGLDGVGLLSTPKPRTLDISAQTGLDLNALTSGALASGVAKLYTGYISLPYYQTAPATSADFSPLGKMWRPDTTLAGQLGKVIPEDYLQTVTGATTTTVPDTTRNVTWRYPFAAKTGNETVPLQVTLPDPTYVSAAISLQYGSPTTCGTFEADNVGYPVAIYIHGITSDRTSVIALAHALAQACIATVAIDLPLHGVDSNSSYVGALNVNHGATMYPLSTPASNLADFYSASPSPLHERHFDQTLNTGTGAPAAMNFGTPNGYDDSGSLFINLRNLQATRDNLKESVQDLLNLNASLGSVSALNLDATGGNDLNLGKVYVIGVSLGGIVGTTFSTVNQLAIAKEAEQGFAANLNPIKGLLVSAGGSQLTQVLINSPTFEPIISAGLGPTAAAGTAARESFLNVAQATVDSADPVNFAGVLDALNVPTLVQMMIGGATTSGAPLNDTSPAVMPWLTDVVVPNSIAGAPLAGTLGLANLLGASVADDTPITAPPLVGSDATAGNLLVQLTIGYHSSLLIPNAYTAPGTWSNGEQLATGELQTEAASFVLSGGASVYVGTANAYSGYAGTFTAP